MTESESGASTLHNVILLTIDCLRADRLSSHGYSRRVTPNIDRLAEKGVLFSTAIANGINTACSFPSILTSTYALMYPRFKENTLFLTHERTSIAEVLGRNGYATAAFHSNPHLAACFGYDKGFDVFEDHMGTRQESQGFVTRVKRKIERKHDKEHGFYKILRSGKSFLSLWKLRKYLGQFVPYPKAEIINREAVEWISNNLNGFFVWMHYMDVHQPYFPPQPLLQHFRAVRLGDRIWKDGRIISHSDLKMFTELYDKEVRYVDHQLGRFFEKLKELGIWLENSYIIITSDHGEEFMEHGGVGHGPNGDRPRMYDELLRVPFIIGGPELPHKKVDNQVALIDLAPTIVELIGLGKNVPFLGQSLVPHIKSSFVGEKGVISEFQYRKQRAYSYRTRNWKYILALNGEVRSELYNLKVDPAEQENIAKQAPSEVRKLKRLIRNHILFEESIDSATEAVKQRIRERISKIKQMTDGACAF